MQILSYRGPSCAGGVSGTIGRLIERHCTGADYWWYLSQNRLTISQHDAVIHHCSVPEKIVRGHYRYSNEFLWPVLHDLPEHARFVAEDRLYYQQLNLSV